MDLRPFIATTAVAAILAGGALASATVSLLGAAEDDAVAMVPATTFFYGNVFLDPSAAQKLALEDLLAKFPEANTPEAAKTAIVRVLDEGLDEMGLSFAADVEPWLGSQVAFFASPPLGGQAPSAGVLIASEDAGAASATLEKTRASGTTTTTATYSGVEYAVSADGGSAAGVVDDFLVLGDERALRAVVDASSGSSLGDSEAYKGAVENLTEDRLATIYVDPRAAFAAIPGGAAAAMPFGAVGPSVSIIYARGDAIVLETSTSGPGATMGLPVGGTELLERLPGDSLAAFGIPGFGQALQQVMAMALGGGGANPEMIEGAFELQFGLSLQDDLLSWIGDIAFFASGKGARSLGGGAVIQATDPERAAASLPKIEAALEQNGVPIKPLGFGEFDGFSVKDRSMPEPIFVVAADERVIIAYGRNATLAALGSDPSLGGTEGFAAAKTSLGDGFAVSGYLDLERIVKLVGDFPGAYGDVVAGPFLDPLDFVVFGTRSEGAETIARMVIGVR